MNGLAMYIGGQFSAAQDYGLFFNHGNANTDAWYLRGSYTGE